MYSSTVNKGYTNRCPLPATGPLSNMTAKQAPLFPSTTAILNQFVV